MKSKHFFTLLAFLAIYTLGFLLLNYNPANISEAVTSKPALSKPIDSNPTTSNPTTSNPTTSNPTTSNPTTSNPTTSNPTTSNPPALKPASPIKNPTKPDVKKERNDNGKVISIEKNQYGSGGWTDFTGYNDDNIRNTYVAGKDIEPGVYWTGIKNDPCPYAYVTTAAGQKYKNLEKGEQSVFHLEKGDSLTTNCNWYQGNMPNYKNESPSGMILASQLGVGEFKVKDTGSCVIIREYLDNFVNSKIILVFEEGSNFSIKITKEDIEKNTVIVLNDSCIGLDRV